MCKIPSFKPFSLGDSWRGECRSFSLRLQELVDSKDDGRTLGGLEV